MPGGPDVSVIVEQVKARLKQIEDQFSQHQRLPMSSSACATWRSTLSTRSCPASAEDNLPPPSRPSVASGQLPPRADSVGRTPRGQNKAKILDALKGRGPMTASEIAKVTGIPAATVSSTLTKMAKTASCARPSAATRSRNGSRRPSYQGRSGARGSQAARER